MNEHFFSKGDPAINEHHCNIIENNTTKRHITHTIYIYIKKTETYNIQKSRYTDGHYNKTQHVNSDITNNISKKH